MSVRASVRPSVRSSFRPSFRPLRTLVIACRKDKLSRYEGETGSSKNFQFRVISKHWYPPRCHRCLHDYVDVYTQAREPIEDLLDVPLHGRYCGGDLDLLPRLLISMHNIFIVGFYSDHQKEERGFLAEYTFIDGCKYESSWDVGRVRERG